jgi:phage baseplate assembly protein W
MTTRVQGWRYLLPDLDAPESAAGLQYSASGAVDLVRDDAAVRQALLLLILTTPGERVMRPTYGCHLRRLLFSPNDDTTAGLAIHYVRSAIERWEPRVDILGLDAIRDPEEPTTMQVILEYRVRATQHTERLVIGYSLEVDAEVVVPA